MPTEVVPSDVESVNIDRIVQAVNDNYYKLIDFQQELRYFQTRLDTIAYPASKIFLGAAVVGGLVGGYLAYTEVRRANKSRN